MEIRSKLADLAVGYLKPGLFLVDVVASSKNLSKVTVVIDGDQGVTIDDCGQLSRDLSAKLDEMGFGIGHYVLEVTTPGIDQPLKLKRQYAKSAGRSLKVHRRDKTIVTGKLIGTDELGIQLRSEQREKKAVTTLDVRVPFEEIEKAFVMVSFN